MYICKEWGDKCWMDGQSLPISRFRRILRGIQGWCKNQSAFFSSSPLSSLGRNSLDAALWRKCKVAGWWWIYVCADFKGAVNDNIRMARMKTTKKTWMMMSTMVMLSAIPQVRGTWQASTTWSKPTNPSPLSALCIDLRYFDVLFWNYWTFDQVYKSCL